MTEMEHINNILGKIINDGASFNVAIRSSLKNDKRANDKEFTSLLTSVCGGYLRHHYSIEATVKNRFPDLDEQSRQIIGIILSNKLFSKKLDEEKALKAVTKEHPELEKDIKEFLNSIDKPFQLIPENVNPESDEYNHYRYNLPLFVAKMWRKNCKYALGKKLFKTFRERKQHVVRIDTNKISTEEFYKKYSDYSPLENNVLAAYSSDASSKKLEPVINGDALSIHSGYTFALQDIDIDFVRGVAIYGGDSNDVLDEIYALKGNHLKLDYLCGAQKHFFEVHSKIKKYGLSGISVYECPHDALRTCISKPVHTLIISPENTAFQKLSEESDYFLKVKQENLDTLIKTQKACLEAASDLVEEDGTLVYVLPTLCRNETYGLIKEFLEQHNEFSLEKEVQLFPFDKYHCMLYFAVLKKEKKND